MSELPRKRVRGYYRQDGTYVAGYLRRRPSADSTAGPRRSSADQSDLGAWIGALIVLVAIAAALTPYTG